MMLAARAAPADGLATSDDLPSAPSSSVPAGARPGTTAGTAGAREGKRWLAAQARPGRRFFLAAGLADLAATAGTVILSWYAAALIVAGVAGGAAGHGLAADVLGVAAGGFLRAAGAFAADRLAAAGASRAEANARDAVLAALVLADPADEQMSAGAAVAAVAEQLPRLGDHFHDYQRRAVTACLAPAVILAVTFPASWVVGVLLALATPIVPVNMAVTGLGAEAVSRRQLHQVAQLSSQVLERLQAMSTLRALGAIGHQRRLVERAATELAQRTTAVLRIAFLASSALEWVSTFAIGLVAMYVGATLLGYVLVPLLPVHLGARVGVFVLLLAPAYFAPLRRFAAAYHQRQEALAAAEILAPLSRRAAVVPGPGPGASGHGSAAATAPGTAGRTVAPASCSAPAVVLQGVTVRFAGRSRPALSDVSVLVPPRTVLGVAGPSGAGKSTLLRVAGGWLRPSEGLVLVDGAPAAGDSGSARALLLGQHPYLFSGTLADNIALGQPGASRARIWAAIEAAQLTALLGRLPDGLDTVLGERGWSISGGEAQRVALARASLSDAAFVLVDEPTAHLDAATEAALIEPLARLLQGRTALVASHSDAVLGIADRVIDLEGGRFRG
ncbi:MAG: thiol reductant exporter, ATP-binding protein CydD [Actinomycetia bacterium]|nr:thiol reductant exporter, ATP-binding protein CydD [Actinomycetes bacterium]